MIVSRIEGGLGNQLFQYAALQSLALRLDVDCYLDLTPFDTYTLHQSVIERFPIRAQPMERSWLARVPLKYGGIGWRRLMPQSFPKLQLVREKDLLSQADFWNTRDNSYLVGYWQSDSYFKSFAAEIRQDLQLNSPLVGQDARIADLMREGHSVTIHIRRGDYVSNPKTEMKHGTCDSNYYQRAVNALEQQYGDLKLFIFSDDPSWCREHLRFHHPTHFVDHNDASKNCEEMRLMSLANNFVIANSSFSWWAAWLSESATKKVYAPKQWFKQVGIEPRGLIPESWLRI